METKSKRGRPAGTGLKEITFADLQLLIGPNNNPTIPVSYKWLRSMNVNTNEYENWNPKSLLKEEQKHKVNVFEHGEISRSANEQEEQEEEQKISYTLES